MDTVTVKATAKVRKEAPRKVILWEVDPNHPGGEVLIAADERIYEAATTPEINLRIRNGELEIVKTNERDGDADEAAAPEAPAAAAKPTSRK